MRFRKFFINENNGVSNKQPPSLSERAHEILDETHAKQMLIHFDEEDRKKKRVFDETAIEGWAFHKNQQLKQAKRAEIKVHKKKSMSMKLEPEDSKYLDNLYVKDSINYLKKMLNQLRNSRENLILTEISKNFEQNQSKQGYNHKRHYNLKNRINMSTRENSKTEKLHIPVQKKDQSYIKYDYLNINNKIKKVNISKQNVENEKDIIQQLINGIWKLPQLEKPQVKIVKRKIKKNQKFTLDKLL